MKKDIQYFMNLPYEVLIRKVDEEDGGGYLACIPLLGENRCEGYGKDPIEALADLEEVKRDLFEDYLSKGWDILEPKKPEEQCSGKLLIRIPKILHYHLSQAAKENGVSLNSYISYLVSENYSTERVSQQVDYICDTIHNLWKWPDINPESKTEKEYSKDAYLQLQ